MSSVLRSLARYLKAHVQRETGTNKKKAWPQSKMVALPQELIFADDRGFLIFKTIHSEA